ncbi:glycine cleavage system protein GcvH [Crassaminicella thermophila]|uniref:Glycine cleavage system H protein n=1 Tax=Crassaminicella thermophila TaxID=2599308 RepID=A0A5C0SID4_CRATE|nr:glycine cleavage system protein GcvH [Crassaminicella thermophila]QEK13447.1 glycine cleavage system protein GcvH [Crassaminicella thermophila]
MKILEGLYYSKDHEWIKVDEGKAYIGITDYAQKALGEIVYVEMPEIDDELNVGDVFGVIESVKAASDSYTPVSGKVIEINEELEDSPQLLNENPYESWIFVIEMRDKSELENLMSSEEYEEFLKTESH